MVSRNKLNIYFTYDTEDTEFVNLIVQALNSMQIFNTFLSPSDLSAHPRTELYSTMKAEIRECDLFLVLFTRKSLRSDLVEKEIRLAVRKGKQIIPFYDSHARVPRIPALLAYQEFRFTNREAKFVVERVLNAAGILQAQLGISSELIREATLRFQQTHRKSGIWGSKRAKAISRSVVLRSIIIQTMKKLGYSIREKDQSNALRLFDFSASKAGQTIWVKCILGIPRLRDVSKLRMFKVPISDEVWIVSTNCNEAARQAAESSGIQIVRSDSLIGELDPIFGRPLLGKIGILEGGGTPMESIETQTGQIGNLLELLQMPEDQLLEFKSTFRYNPKKMLVDARLEKACLKTVCAFLNARGGRLVIGVSNDRQPIGLSSDYKTLKRQDRDGLENHIINTISSRVGSQFLCFVRVTFRFLGNREICIIEISPSSKPAFLKEGDTEEFYVRTGNSSRPFSMVEAVEYIKEHWK